jgi:hypothetical protein
MPGLYVSNAGFYYKPRVRGHTVDGTTCGCTTSDAFPSGPGVPGCRTIERSEASRRNKVLPAVVYGTEAFQVEVFLVYCIARYCLIAPASKCVNPENIGHAHSNS